MQEQLATRGVSLDLIKPISSISEVALNDPLYEKTFDLCERKTRGQLILEYADTIYNAQQNYMKAVTKADTILLRNIQECTKADNVLGVSPVPMQNVSCSASDKTLKDGSKHLKCPMVGCMSNIFKLKRHLVSQHPSLNGYQIKYAQHISKLMFLHSPVTKETEVSGDSNLLDKRKPMQTNFVYKKLNPKQCPLCTKLLLNMGDHLSNVHNLIRSSSQYKSYLSDALVVPKCYTKIINGETVKLSGDELMEAEIAYDSQIKNQAENLSSLAQLKSEMATLRSHMNETKVADEYNALKLELLDLESKYKALRQECN